MKVRCADSNAKTLLDSKSRLDCFTPNCQLKSAGKWPAQPAQSHNSGRDCQGSVFQQHYPTRKRSPRMSKRPPVPFEVSGEDADDPKNDEQRRGRRQEMAEARGDTKEIRPGHKKELRPWATQKLPAATRVSPFLARPQSLIRRQLTSQQATAEVPPGSVTRTRDH